jgi:hypothetical protein
MNLAELQKLHDAQLATIAVDWSGKRAQLRIRHGWPSTWSDLTLSGLRTISVTTLDEWGPSVHIHRINLEPADAATRFLIEMQSGDVINIVAGSIELLPVENA